MLSESWLKVKHSYFLSSIHKRQRESEAKANDDQNQESGDPDRLDVLVEYNPE